MAVKEHQDELQEQDYSQKKYESKQEAMR
jgi:hypothetical protein